MKYDCHGGGLASSAASLANPSFLAMGKHAAVCCNMWLSDYIIVLFIMHCRPYVIPTTFGITWHIFIYVIIIYYYTLWPYIALWYPLNFTRMRSTLNGYSGNCALWITTGTCHSMLTVSCEAGEQHEAIQAVGSQGFCLLAPHRHPMRYRSIAGIQDLQMCSTCIDSFAPT